MILKKKDEKLQTYVKTSNAGDVINKCYLDEKFLKINADLPLLEKVYNEFPLNNNKQSVEEILIQRAVKTTTQILYDKGVFDAFPNADKVLKDLLFVTRPRSDLEKVNYVIQ